MSNASTIVAVTVAVAMPFPEIISGAAVTVVIATGGPGSRVTAPTLTSPEPVAVTSTIATPATVPAVYVAVYVPSPLFVTSPTAPLSSATVIVTTSSVMGMLLRSSVAVTTVVAAPSAVSAPSANATVMPDGTPSTMIEASPEASSTKVEVTVTVTDTVSLLTGPSKVASYAPAPRSVNSPTTPLSATATSVSPTTGAPSRSVTSTDTVALDAPSPSIELALNCTITPDSVMSTVAPNCSPSSATVTVWTT